MFSRPRSTPSLAADDRGSAVVEFVLVGALVVVLATGLLQLALTLHVRNIMASCASEGAHVGALAVREPADGEARAVQLAEAALGGRTITATSREVTDSGTTVVEITLTTSVPMLGLWGGGTMSATAHAIEESPDG